MPYLTFDFESYGIKFGCSRDEEQLVRDALTRIVDKVTANDMLSRRVNYRSITLVPQIRNELCNFLETRGWSLFSTDRLNQNGITLVFRKMTLPPC